MGRLLIVSNRLPVTARLADGEVQLDMAGGGLATGLRPWHEQSGGLWIGWPGDVSAFPEEARRNLDRMLDDRRVVPVHLSRDHVDRNYNGFSNRVLWPLFHYLVDRVPVDAADWEAYRQVNEVFADVVAHEYRPGDRVWVHDYQLMLMPALLRRRLPQARIGFFLHIPFPSSEVFRVLPWRREILQGLLGADLVGFHTFAYLRHFVESLLHIDGVEAAIDRVHVGDREVALGVFPMGIDAQHFARLAGDPEVVAETAAIRRDAGGRRIVLGVDRLDYTKGIPRRLKSVERLLTRDADLRDSLRYIQVAVPSRGEVDAYQRFRQLVEETVGRLNGASATLRSTPVHYIHQSVTPKQLVALYCAADVMLVTPLRDGMNLVAKEFLASRADGDGVLVLSEFAGAAAELSGAMMVNPYDVDAVADTIRRALDMPAEERRARLAPARRRVFDYDVHAWAADFMTALEATDTRATGARPSLPTPPLRAALASALEAGSIRLLLDYDGTLVPPARAAGLAAPDAALLALLTSLAASPGIEVELTSGRSHETLTSWFDTVPVGLWAEQGFWHRPAPGSPWQPASGVHPDWMKRVLPILERFTATTPGSQIETSHASVTWHYRDAQREFGSRQAHELRMLLGGALSNQPLEVLASRKMVEVRLRGTTKAAIVLRAPTDLAVTRTVVAIGDDRSDEELFLALPDGSITVAVGERLRGATYLVDDYRAVRQLLQFLVDRGLPASRLHSLSSSLSAAASSGTPPPVPEAIRPARV